MKKNIEIFMNNHADFFAHVVRCLYVRNDTEETYVLECREYKGERTTYVFCYECGYFYKCMTEINTFEKYCTLIPESDNSEFIKLRN